MPSKTLILRTCLAIPYTLVAAEFFIRIFAPVPLMPRYVCGTDYGIRGNVPNARYVHKTPDYRIEFTVNSKGVRSDEEIPYEKPPGEKRIVCLGDSFTMGYGAQLDETFHAQLASHLQADGINVKVVNLGVSGHGTAEELLALQHEGLKYQPDMILVGWHFTDLLDNTRSGLFRLKDGALQTASDTYLPAVKVREYLFSFAAYRWLASSSHLYVFFRETAGEFAKRTVSVLRGGPPAAEKPTGSAPTKASDTEQELSYPERLSVALLEAIYQEAESVGASMLIIDIPRRNSVGYYPGLVSKPGVLNPNIAVYCPADDLNQQIDELLIWRRSAFHFTPLGNSICGDGLARVVREKNLIK